MTTDPVDVCFEAIQYVTWPDLVHGPDGKPTTVAAVEAYICAALNQLEGAARLAEHTEGDCVFTQPCARGIELKQSGGGRRRDE